MSAPALQTQPLHPGPKPPWLLIGTATALWLLVINQLRVEWSINEQYSYGWTVPFLALYLLLERWKTRPDPAPARSPLALGIIAALLLLTLLPTRLIQEAAPDWRLLGWAIAGAVVGLTLCGFWFVGGMRWARHFAFPVCFFLIAVPWPVPFEQALIQQLMRSIAAICVEALAFWGVPATQHGNVIELTTGAVGVEEACSGVRSLQTTLMASLFLGELLRLHVTRRALLLASGLLLALICNAGRALSLVWLSVHFGKEGIDRWHDTIGLTVLVVSLAGIGGIAAALRPREAQQTTGLRITDYAGSARAGAFPKPLLFAVLGWLALIEIGTEIWYRSHESSFAKNTSWTIEFPRDRPNFRPVKIAEATQSILHYDEAESAAWTDADGKYWSAVFIRWFPGRASAQLAKAHGPEICLPATGMRLQEDLGTTVHQVRGVTLPVRSFIFDSRGRTVHVFFSLWEDRVPLDPRAVQLQRLDSTSRLAAVRMGRRNLGQQVFEAAIGGASSSEEARQTFLNGVEQMMRKTDDPSAP